jgi:two-component system response regulator (stage 0 sporulation protein A)
MESTIQTRISGILHEIGIPAHIRGYRYIREAIVLTLRDRSVINAVTKELYPAVAKTFSTTPSRVERAIRHAIVTAWARGNAEMLRSFFYCQPGSKTGRPTNSEFIATIAEHLELQTAA